MGKRFPKVAASLLLWGEMGSKGRRTSYEIAIGTGSGERGKRFSLACARRLRGLGRCPVPARGTFICCPLRMSRQSGARYDDHRMAMCFSLVACAGVPVIINDPGCTSKTFPDYFDKLDAITHAE